MLGAGLLVGLATLGWGESAKPPDAPQPVAAQPALELVVEEAAIGETILIGEVVDLSLWLTQHRKGAAHQVDAAAFARGGSPAGFLTADGELYLLLAEQPGGSPLGPIVPMQMSHKLKVAGQTFEAGDHWGVIVRRVVRDYGLAE